MSRPKEVSAAASFPKPQRAVVDAKLEGNPVNALLDSGSSENFIDENVVNEQKLNIFRIVLLLAWLISQRLLK